MDLFLPIFICKIVLKVFLSPMDYGPLLQIFRLQGCTKSLPFTYALHNFFFYFIWYHLNYCKNPAVKEHHLPCHSQCRMHAYLHPSIEISTTWEIKDLFSIAGIPDGFWAHNTLTMFLTLCDLPYKRQLPVLDARGAIKITSCNVKL